MSENVAQVCGLDMIIYTSQVALFPGLPRFFVLWFAFSIIIHGTTSVYYTEAWERGYFTGAWLQIALL